MNARTVYPLRAVLGERLVGTIKAARLERGERGGHVMVLDMEIQGVGITRWPPTPAEGQALIVALGDDTAKWAGVCVDLAGIEWKAGGRSGARYTVTRKNGKT